LHAVNIVPSQREHKSARLERINQSYSADKGCSSGFKTRRTWKELSNWLRTLLRIWRETVTFCSVNLPGCCRLLKSCSLRLTFSPVSPNTDCVSRKRVRCTRSRWKRATISKLLRFLRSHPNKRHKWQLFSSWLMTTWLIKRHSFGFLRDQHCCDEFASGLTIAQSERWQRKSSRPWAFSFQAVVLR